MKKKLAMIIAATMVMSMAFGVTSMADYQVNEDLDLETPVTLNVYGPGLFTTGEDGQTDLVSGISQPGYDVIVERWNELYPNCELVIEDIPWDNWQAGIQTACLSGDVDVIIHGATLTDITTDLAPYLEADPDYADQIFATAARRTTEHPDEYKISGISVVVGICNAVIDKQKFEDFGVELPTTDWTPDDLLSLAEQLTGTDPVTGEESYGIQWIQPGGTNLLFNYISWANAFGAEVFTYGETLDDCVVDYTCDESVAAFEFIEELAQYGSPEAKEGLAVSETPDGTNDWAIMLGEGIVSWYYQAVAAGLEDRYEFITMPICVDGEYAGVPTPYAGDVNLAMYYETDKPDWSWEFIKFMTSDDVAVQWVADTLRIPNNVAGADALRSVLPDDVVDTINYALESLPENYTNATNKVQNSVSFGATQNTMNTMVDNVINGYMTPEEAAQAMQDYVEEYLAGDVE